MVGRTRCGRGRREEEVEEEGGRRGRHATATSSAMVAHELRHAMASTARRGAPAQRREQGGAQCRGGAPGGLQRQWRRLWGRREVKVTRRT